MVTFCLPIPFALTCCHGGWENTQEAGHTGESRDGAAVFQRHYEDAAAQAAEVHTEI